MATSLDSKIDLEARTGSETWRFWNVLCSSGDRGGGRDSMLRKDWSVDALKRVTAGSYERGQVQVECTLLGSQFVSCTFVSPAFFPPHSLPQQILPEETPSRGILTRDEGEGGALPPPMMSRLGFTFQDKWNRHRSGLYFMVGVSYGFFHLSSGNVGGIHSTASHMNTHIQWLNNRQKTCL